MMCLQCNYIILYCFFNRKNIFLSASVKMASALADIQSLKATGGAFPTPAIIYCRTKKDLHMLRAQLEGDALC